MTENLMHHLNLLHIGKNWLLLVQITLVFYWPTTFLSVNGAKPNNFFKINLHEMKNLNSL